MNTRGLGLRAALLTAAGLVLGAGGIAAQSVASRTPNILGGWTPARGVVQFNFVHRFSMTDAPLRKVINTPTFVVGAGLTDWLMAGFLYGSNSTLVPAYPNEWEFFGRAMPLAESRDAAVDLSIQAGYNVASESLDGEVLLARTLGSLRLLAGGRAFSEGYDGTDARFAVVGGAAINLSRSVSIAGDYSVLTDRADDEDAAWGVGLQLGVPYTPHSLSIHVTNVGTGSLEGASRGTRTRWGFEYTVPITIRRYTAGGATETRPAEAGATGTEVRTVNTDTVVIEMRNLTYGTTQLTVPPGTTVVWVNRDPLQHTVTSDTGAFDSDLIDPGERYVRTFTQVGAYPYHCTPHPFMKGTIVVEAMTGGDQP
ncbi:MAG TPA: cupredoxin family copper-binding protein [Longimicrobiales bacterium]|jgi:plastocyanin